MRGKKNKLRSSCEAYSSWHKLTVRLRPNYRARNASPPPGPQSHITKRLFRAVPFTQYIVLAIKEKKKKITCYTPQQKTQFEKREQALEPDMAGMLELSEQEFKIARIKMPRALMDKVDNMKEQMVDVSRNREILRKNQKDMLVIKTSIKERNPCMGLLVD